jgi:hypothetical protein
VHFEKFLMSGVREGFPLPTFAEYCTRNSRHSNSAREGHTNGTVIDWG